MLITDHLKDQRDEATRHAPRTTEPRVLIADDQPDVLEALRLLLRREGFEFVPASSPAGVVAALVILAVLLIWRLFRFFRQVVTRFSRRPTDAEPAPTTQ